MVTSAPPSSDSPAEPPQRLTDEPWLSIAAVERETGLGKDTLRAWERRYGFPQPRRDAAGMRGYPRAMVDRLRLIQRALLAGQRPGRLLAMPAAELDALLAGLAPAPRAHAAAFDIAGALAVLRAGDAQALRHRLALAAARLGLASFVIDGLGPLTAAVGQGSVAAYEERLYGEAVQSVLRAALAPLQAALAPHGPSALLTTVPGEAQALGPLMAEALMTLEVCRCLPLGTQTPLADIAAAAQARRIDVAALSFSANLAAAQALPALAELRAMLPDSVQVWAIADSTALRGVRIAGIRVVNGLAGIAEAVADWRRHGGPAAD